MSFLFNLFLCLISCTSESSYICLIQGLKSPLMISILRAVLMIIIQQGPGPQISSQDHHQCSSHDHHLARARDSSLFSWSSCSGQFSWSSFSKALKIIILKGVLKISTSSDFQDHYPQGNPQVIILKGFVKVILKIIILTGLSRSSSSRDSKDHHTQCICQGHSQDHHPQEMCQGYSQYHHPQGILRSFILRQYLRVILKTIILKGFFSTLGLVISH